MNTGGWPAFIRLSEFDLLFVVNIGKPDRGAVRCLVSTSVGQEGYRVPGPTDDPSTGIPDKVELNCYQGLQIQGTNG
jgi:hypothetical protein